MAVYARALRPVAPQSAFTRCRREADTRGWTVSSLLYDTERSLRYWRHLMERLRTGRCDGIVADRLDPRFFDAAEIRTAADLVERTDTFLVVLDGGPGGRSAFGSPPV
ncbi:hypothetical protein [Kitasatospora sp. NPDC088548]|uniref:hypothetical protein n=1 Tax=Kitasatospora sp. NPDC088548 TaxID=3364075 RepID=UPI00381A9861